MTSLPHLVTERPCHERVAPRLLFHGLESCPPLRGGLFEASHRRYPGLLALHPKGVQLIHHPGLVQVLQRGGHQVGVGLDAKVEKWSVGQVSVPAQFTLWFFFNVFLFCTWPYGGSTGRRTCAAGNRHPTGTNIIYLHAESPDVGS